MLNTIDKIEKLPSPSLGMIHRLLFTILTMFYSQENNDLIFRYPILRRASSHLVLVRPFQKPTHMMEKSILVGFFNK